MLFLGLEKTEETTEPSGPQKIRGDEVGVPEESPGKDVKKRRSPVNKSCTLRKIYLRKTKELDRE